MTVRMVYCVVKGVTDVLQITATDFKSNLGKYLTLVHREEIHITKNGVDIAVLSAPKPRLSVVDELRGVIPADIDVRAARAERLARQ